MDEHDEPENDGQLPFPARKDDQEHVERSEKQGRKSGWVLDAISLILDGISNALPFLQARGSFPAGRARRVPGDLQA
jgi:hypothetical protein